MLKYKRNDHLFQVANPDGTGWLTYVKGPQAGLEHVTIVGAGKVWIDGELSSPLMSVHYRLGVPIRSKSRRRAVRLGRKYWKISEKHERAIAALQYA